MNFGVFAAVLVAGCYSPTIHPGAPCTTSDECPGGQECVANVCGGMALPPDASVDIDAAVMLSDAPPDAAPIVQIVIGDDSAEMRDTELNGNDMLTVFGAGDHFSIDSAENGLVWFDLTSIPSTETVLSATLRVTVADAASTDGGTVTIHRLREAWVESEATWQVRATGQAWSISGARSPASDVTPVASFTPAAVDTAYDIALPATLVQAWIDDPASNFGVLFARGTSTMHVHMRTRESGVQSVLTLQVQ